MLDAIRLETLGKPTITLIQDRFERAARLHAKAGGLPELPLLIEPAPDDGSSIQRNVQAFIAEHLAAILGAFTRAVDKPET